MVAILIMVTLYSFDFFFSFSFSLATLSIIHHHFIIRFAYLHPMMLKLWPHLLICYLKFSEAYFLVLNYYLLTSLSLFSSSSSSNPMKVTRSYLFFISAQKVRYLHHQSYFQMIHFNLFTFYVWIFYLYAFYAFSQTFIDAFYVLILILIFYVFYVFFYFNLSFNLNHWTFFVSFWVYQFQSLLNHQRNFCYHFIIEKFLPLFFE